MLVEVEGCPFAFTAEHVLTDAGDSLLYVATGPKGILKILQCRHGFHSRAPKTGLDFDVGILSLVRSELDRFEGWVFLGSSDVDEDHQVDLALGRNSYFTFGYSASPSQVKVSNEQRHIRQASFQFTGLAEPPSTYDKESLDPTVHLVLEFDHKNMRVVGQRVTPPKLQGVSGGGIFHLSDLSLAPQTRLVGVATEHRKRSRVVVGTRIEHFANSARLLIRRHGDTLFE